MPAHDMPLHTEIDFCRGKIKAIQGGAAEVEQCTDMSRGRIPRSFCVTTNKCLSQQTNI